MDPKLTLEDAKRKARQREAVSGQQDIVQDTGATPKNAQVEPVAKTKTRRAHYSPHLGGGNKDNKTTPRQSSGAEKCTRCGRGNTPGRNVQLEKLCATLVRNEGTIAPSASKEHNSVLQR